MPWTKRLPLALLRIRVAPRRDLGISPYGMMFGLPYMGNRERILVPELGESCAPKYVLTIVKTLELLREKGKLPQTTPLDFKIHNIQAGDLGIGENREGRNFKTYLGRTFPSAAHYRNSNSNKRKRVDSHNASKRTSRAAWGLGGRDTQRPLEINHEKEVWWFCFDRKKPWRAFRRRIRVSTAAWKQQTAKASKVPSDWGSTKPL